MQGVTTAIVAFLLVCIVFPSLVRNKPQYYATWCCILLMIVLDALSRINGGAGPFATFVYVVNAFLQVAAILLLILCAGGVTVRQLADDVAHAYEVMRRGETEKTIVIPFTGEMPKPRQEASSPLPPDVASAVSSPAANVYVIHPPAAVVAPARKADAEGSLPLE